MNRIVYLKAIIANQQLPGASNILFGILPLVFVLLYFRKLKAIKARLRSTTSNTQTERPHQHGALAKCYFRIAAQLHIAILGRFANYDKKHLDYLASGQRCQQCGETLLDRAWLPSARCLDSSGNPIPVIEAGKRGSEFECPHCQHRWPLRKEASPQT